MASLHHRCAPIWGVFVLCTWLAGCGWQADDTQRALRDVDQALQLLADQSKSWQDTLRQLEDKLAKDAQSTLRNEVDNTLQRGIAASGAELRCNADFIRVRITEHIRNIKADLLRQARTPIVPSICQVVPSVIDLRLPADRRSVVSFVGYDMDVSTPSRIAVKLIDRNSSEGDVSSAFAGTTHYLMTLNVAQNGIEFHETSDKVAVRWGNDTLSTLLIVRDPERFRAEIFTNAAAPSANPTVSATPPADYQLIGGGCRSEWQGPGQLLTASFPSGNSWTCTAKAHAVMDTAGLTAFAVAVRRSMNLDILIVPAGGGAPSDSPSASAQLPATYSVIGGGCQTSWQSPQPGNYIVNSYPTSNAWICSGKAHSVSSPASMTAFVIGIHSDSLAAVSGYPVTAGPRSGVHNDVAAGLPDQSIGLVGGGCRVDYGGPGQLLTASFPDMSSQQWSCTSKDHVVADPARITAFPLGLKWNRR